MKHYKKPNNSIWAFESDGSQDQLITDDMTPISDAELYILHNPEQSTEQIKASIVQVTQQRLDDFAKTRNYDNILSACTYATSSIPKFLQEGQSAVNARDTTWSALYTILAEVESGSKSMPKGFTDIEPFLPVLEW